MWTYEQAYGFTRLRVLVSAAELWFAIVFVWSWWPGSGCAAGRGCRGRSSPRRRRALLGVAAAQPGPVHRRAQRAAGYTRNDQIDSATWPSSPPMRCRR